jgi:hypothetical protein
MGPPGSAARTLLDLIISELQYRRVDQHWLNGSCVSRVARFVLAWGNEPELLAYLPKRVAAALLGMRPETFSRCITKFASGGCIGRDWKHLQILDHRRLELLAAGNAMAS